MKKKFEKSNKVFDTTASRLISEFDSGMKIVNGVSIFASLERLDNPKQEFDEKHYFIIPFYLSETGFSLHIMRSLPSHVSEINALPKRRVFHFPNEHYEAILREYMVSSAKDLSYEKSAGKLSSLESLANEIDALDSKLTYGMLIIGGIAALFNPLVGAGIAAKAAMPSVSRLLTKYALRPVGKKLTQSHVQQQAKEAEQNVLKQFSESNTLKVTNPILQELEFALRTNERQHDPLIDPDLSSGSIPELGNDSWRELTERAVFHVYNEVVEDSSKHDAAKLGPEDVRWLKSMFAGRKC